MRKQLGLRASYKSDTHAEQTPARKAVRKRVIEALKKGEPLGIRLVAKMEREIVSDGSGDLLDAVICAAQAAWAALRPSYGIPAHAPAREGWIISS